MRTGPLDIRGLGERIEHAAGVRRSWRKLPTCQQAADQLWGPPTPPREPDEFSCSACQILDARPEPAPEAAATGRPARGPERGACNLSINHFRADLRPGPRRCWCRRRCRALRPLPAASWPALPMRIHFRRPQQFDFPVAPSGLGAFYIIEIIVIRWLSRPRRRRRCRSSHWAGLIPRLFGARRCRRCQSGKSRPVRSPN